MMTTLTRQLQEHKPLKNLSNFGIGGPARYYASVNSVDDMCDILRFASQENLPYIILGKGSNCLFDDRGYDGLVIHNKIDFMNDETPSIFYVGAGYSFSRFGAMTARKGWSGLEFASGIPGTIGGAIYMNAGANGGETCDTLTSVEFVTPDGNLVRYERNELDFSYRTSPFQQLPGAIVAATFTLFASENARYDQINIVRYRQATQPYDMPSAGCIFRNPTVGSAGALIDKVGLKGLRVGGAVVSPVHANFIVNGGNATSADVLALILTVQERILEATGISLESEVVYVPYEGVKQGILHG
ncbi:MAG: UDP-N-acetylmuramate dehydrogenase [Chlamydiales bacterium]|nr:UDP-N-acetylmuramate dehydrogenase [Chlamydiales bacterium]